MLRIGVVMYQTSLTKGQELVAQRMVKELRAQNYDAFLITSPNHDGQAVISDEELAMHGGYVYLFDERLGIPVIRVESVPTTWPPRRASLIDFIETLSKIVDNFKLNVLITHSTLWNGPEEILKFVEWRRNLSRYGVPALTPIFAHMSHFQEASAERYGVVERSFREAWNQTSLSLIVREADLILVVTPEEKELMKERGATDEKCFLFPGGIEELVGLVGDPSALLAKLGLSRDTKIVTTLGTVEERKNTLNVVEVAKRLQDRKEVHFVIAGTEQGDYGAKVRSEASRLSNVSILGSITDMEKSALIAATSVNLIMSRSEALGITQLEFLTNGVPVVSSGAGGQEWVVKDGKNGIVVEGADDIDGAAAAVTKLVDDDVLRRKLGKNARQSADEFSIARLTQALAKRLEKLTRERSDDERLRLSIEKDEHELEAMVNGRLRVIVTNRRILVKYDHDGGKTVSVPLREITKITRHISSSWRILAAGIVSSWMVFLAMLAPSVHSYLGSIVPATAAGALALMLLPFIPFGVSVPFYLMSIRNGYSIISESGSVFLPQQFIPVLKLVDRLSDRELFDEEEPSPRPPVPEPKAPTPPETLNAPDLVHASQGLLPGSGSGPEKMSG